LAISFAAKAFKAIEMVTSEGTTKHGTSTRQKSEKLSIFENLTYWKNCSGTFETF
jgi:hypothetical protein